MKGRKLFSICLLVGAWCFSALVMAQENCRPPEGLSAITSDRARKFLVFGETHGTVEAPALFAESVCAVVGSGKEVLVGLEFPEESAEAFTRFMNSAGTAEDLARFLADSVWIEQAAQFPDGRTSEAMLAMVSRLRELRASGFALSVVPFMRTPEGPGDSQTPYEKELAASLMESASRESVELVMVLVGNLHAFKLPVAAGGGFDPMAMHLPPNETITLNMRSDGRTAWNCAPECASHPLRASRVAKVNGIVLDGKLAPGYDGVYDIGAASASPPVLAAPQ